MADPETWGERYPNVAGFVASGASVAAGVVVTNWVDVIKVRQQISENRSRNFFLTGLDVIRAEGPLGLYRGCSMAIFRGVVYGGARIGLYTPVKDLLGANSAESPLSLKISAGVLSGAVAAGVTNPTDLLKTSVQSRSKGQGGIRIAADLVRTQGIRSLWKGTTPSMVRAATLTAAQCATYDEVKLFFVRNLGWEDTVGTHLAVSTLAGLVTATVISPVDMVKTNVFVNPKYSGPVDCTLDILRTQGIRGMFKGWGANWARQGPMTTVIFVTLEALRHHFGLEAI